MMSTTRKVRALAIATAVSILGFASALPAAARDTENPDWPCQQRKVVNLTSGALWDGPAVDDIKDFNNASDIRELARFLIARRIPLDQAEGAIKKFTEAQPADARDEKLKILFAGVLSYTNADRRTVMNGIERFNKRQISRAAELERQGLTLPADGEHAPVDKLTASGSSESSEKYNWDVRVFQERQQSLPIACEIPTLMEQRAFEIGRLIRMQMKS